MQLTAPSSLEALATNPAPLAVGQLDFRVALQPIVHVPSGVAAAHEALVRGSGGEAAYSVLSQVPPSARNNFDRALQAAAINEFARTNRSGYVSINMLPTSARADGSVLDDGFVQSALHSGLPLERVIVEISESENIEDWPALIEKMALWQSFGAKIAYDDFCAGYSGLTFLSKFRPDLVKIDMALVRDIDKDLAKQSLVESIAVLCSNMGVTVIAEGIETHDESEALLRLGVEYQQGYYWSRPELDLAFGKVYSEPL